MTKDSPPKPMTARDCFKLSVRREFAMGRKGASQLSSGNLLAQTNWFDPSNNRMKGFAVIDRGGEEWFWKAEGNPSLIDPILGGTAKRLRDPSSSDPEDRDGGEVGVHSSGQGLKSEKSQLPTVEGGAGNVKPEETRTFESKTPLMGVCRTPKRIRTSELLGLGAVVPSCLDGPPDEGPSRNTRSKAGATSHEKGANKDLKQSKTARAPNTNTRRSNPNPSKPKAKGKTKAEPEPDQRVAEITAGIDGFSVFSNRQADLSIPCVPPPPPESTTQEECPGVNAGDWAHSVPPSAKVAEWLGKSAEAGTPLPTDAPRSAAPSVAVIA